MGRIVGPPRCEPTIANFLGFDILTDHVGVFLLAAAWLKIRRLAMEKLCEACEIEPTMSHAPDEIPGGVRDVCRMWSTKHAGTYLELHVDERPRIAPLLSLLAGNADGPLHDRRTLPGHITATGVVVDIPSRQVLLIRHKVLNRWLPPGGHLEPGELPSAAARREVAEEVGLTDLTPIGDGPVDIDIHPIPANPARGEPAHFHHDFRFAFSADPAMPLKPQAGEVSAAVWVVWDDPRVPTNLRVALDKLMVQ